MPKINNMNSTIRLRCNVDYLRRNIGGDGNRAIGLKCTGCGVFQLTPNCWALGSWHPADQIGGVQSFYRAKFKDIADRADRLGNNFPRFRQVWCPDCFNNNFVAKGGETK